MQRRKKVKTTRLRNSSTFSLPMLSLASLAGMATAQQSNSPAAMPAADVSTPGTVAVAELDKAPSVTLYNGSLSVRIFLPDAHRGFYRGTRFDWAGIIGGLTYDGHDFYPPWFDAVSAGIRDYEFDEGSVIVSPNTGATGPAEEFRGVSGALGYAEASPGGTFVKIGVGVLQKIDESDYDRFRLYPLVDAGERVNVVSAGRADFVHRLSDAASGYAYDYTKTIRLEDGSPVMWIEHDLRNTGERPIDVTVYNHNFLNIDAAGTTDGLELTTGYELHVEQLPDPALAEVRGNSIVYTKAPNTEQRVSARLDGYGSNARDYDFHIVNRKLGAAVRITGDRPLARAVLWSIQPVMSVEPFVAISIAPGESFTWSYRYAFESGAD